MLDETPETPDWQVLQLGRKLRDRRKRARMWSDYYRGDHPLPQGPRKATEAYREFLRKARTNFCATAVDASVFRLLAIGIADGNGRPIDAAWRWWQQNKMDARQKQIYRTSLAGGVSYAMVGPHPRDPKRPLITPEHPNEVIVDRDAETGDTTTGLKAWWDQSSRRGRVTLYRRTSEGAELIRYRTVSERSERSELPWGAPSWEQMEDPRLIRAMPIVEFPCRPELGEDPEPEFLRGRDIQDRINLGMLNRMTAERYTAWRQKYVTGHKFRRKTDPATGLEVVEQPFIPDPGSVWASEGEDVKFGEFSQTDLLGYLRTHEADVRDFLITTHTPAWLYVTELINIATDTVMALDTMHVSKVLEHHAFFGEALEEMFAIAALIAGDESIDFTAAEVRWKDPRQLNPAVVADMATKKKSIGYPLDILAEDMGESPQRIKRITAGANAAQLLSSLAPTFQPPGRPAGQPTAGAPPANGGQPDPAGS